MKKLSHQQLMDKAYNKWRSGKLKNATGKQFFNALNELEKTAVCLGNLNYQVNNGGFYQWEDNGYKSDHKEFLQRILKGLDLKKFPQLFIGLSLINKATTSKKKDECDYLYYSLTNILQEMDYYIQYLQD